MKQNKIQDVEKGGKLYFHVLWDKKATRNGKENQHGVKCIPLHYIIVYMWTFSGNVFGI